MRGMGYTTDFEGRFELHTPLLAAHKDYLRAFSDTRRMRRNPKITVQRDDRLREAAQLPVGLEGGYFVAEAGHAGQNHAQDVTDYNNPPAEQPGLWCQWVPTDDGYAIVWDEGEKFYNYVEWLEYLVKHFLAPWGYLLNGVVSWQGEDGDDVGRICVIDNDVTVKRPRIVWD